MARSPARAAAATSPSYVPFLAIVGLVIVLSAAEPDRTSVPAGQPLGIPVRGFGVMLMLATIAARRPGCLSRVAGRHRSGDHLFARLLHVHRRHHRRPAVLHRAELIEGDMVIPQDGIGCDRCVRRTRQGDAQRHRRAASSSMARCSRAFRRAFGICRRRGLPILRHGRHHRPQHGRGSGDRPHRLLPQRLLLRRRVPDGELRDDVSPRKPTVSQSVGLAAGKAACGCRGGRQVGLSLPTSLRVATPSARALRLATGSSRINGAHVESLADARKLLAAAIDIATKSKRPTAASSAGPPRRRRLAACPSMPHSFTQRSTRACWRWCSGSIIRFAAAMAKCSRCSSRLHPISRFVLEMIRSDEPGQFGTGLTISQWLSLAILAAACVLWWYVETQPAVPLPARQTDTTDK